MERLSDLIWLGLACLVAPLLFLLGVRQIQRRGASPATGRFFFFLSLALVGLNTLFGCTRPGKQPPVPVATASPTASPATLSRVALQGELQQPYDRLRAPGEAASAKETADQAQQIIARLHQSRALEQEEAQYLRGVFAQLGDRSPRQPDQDLQALNAQDQILMHLNSSQYFDPFLAGLLKDQVRDTLRRSPQGPAGHDQYRELVSRVQDNLYLYYQKSRGSASLEPVISPDESQRPVSKYGVRPIPMEPRPEPAYGVRPIPQLAAPVGTVQAVSGDLWLKRPGKSWARLSRGMQLTTTSVLENRGEQPASLGFGGGQLARAPKPLAGQAVVTGWEFEPGTVHDDLP